MRIANQRAAEELAKWLAKNQPIVFKALVAKANTAGKLSGITDWLTGIGSSVTGAVSAVGSFLTSPQGIATLGTVGGLYLQSQAQKDALKLQTAYAQQGYSPAPIATSGPTSTTPYYTDPTTGQRIPLTPQLTQQLMPSGGLSQWMPYVLIGGGLLAFLLLRR